MKKEKLNVRALALLMAFVLVMGFMPLLSMAGNEEPGENAEEMILYAGQDIEVGTVTVWNDAEYIYVHYELNQYAIDEGWYLTEIHVHVGEELGDFPLAGRWGNPVPGQFDYKEYFDLEDEVTEYTVEIDLGDWGFGAELIIAAHAVIEKIECELVEEAPYSPSEVIDYEQGVRKDGTPVREGRSNPEAVLTYDLGRDETNFFSLGFKFDDEGNVEDEGGWIIVKFDCPIQNGEGYDIMVVEDTWGTYPIETANVYASQDGEEWVYLGEADNEERDPDHNIHTVSYFDLEDVGMEWAKYIKVVDTTPIEPMPNDGDGYDLNVVLALQDCYECTYYDETAWAAYEPGEIRFTERGNWATYFEYTVACEEVQLLQNPGAEEGMDYWEYTEDVVRSIGERQQSTGWVYPRTGDYFFDMTESPASYASMWQEVDVSGYGGCPFTAGGWIQTEWLLGDEPGDVDDHDYGQLIVTFYDSDGDELESFDSGPIGNPVKGVDPYDYDTGAEQYDEFELTGYVPDGAVSAVYELEGYLVEGAYINVFYEDLYFWVGK